jgi:predicted dehydrogenase
MSAPKTLVIIGAGSRGLGVYADYARRRPDQFRVVGCCEPREHYRQQAAQIHGLAPQACFRDWRDLLAAPKLADAAVVATQDKEHLEPALALMGQGYDLLLEKPMDPTLAGCQQLAQQSRQQGCLLVVAHVLRYTPYFKALKKLAASGMLGQLATVRHLEPVHYWHQAHSFVRGNWRNQEQSAPMILAKSCHDLDMLCHLVGEAPRTVSSFGRLSHFRPEQRPPEAADRCLDCPLAESICPYSATRYYLGQLQQGNRGWPVDVLTPDTTPEGVTRALREGPYGRCVYACDNDVVDHQVVAMEFASGVSATFTMTAFTEHRWRETELLGSHGQLVGDGLRIRYTPFTPTLEPHWIDGAQPQPNGEFLWDFSQVPTTGHGGGDDGLMDFFHWCLSHRQAAWELPLAEEALIGHALCFAAEQARLERRLVELVG